jgi:hypothetical protein
MIDATNSNPHELDRAVSPELAAGLGSAGEGGIPAPTEDSVGIWKELEFQEQLGQHETTRFSAVFVENQDSFGAVMIDATNSELAAGLGSAGEGGIPAPTEDSVGIWKELETF